MNKSTKQQNIAPEAVEDDCIITAVIEGSNKVESDCEIVNVVEGSKVGKMKTKTGKNKRATPYSTKNKTSSPQQKSNNNCMCKFLTQVLLDDNTEEPDNGQCKCEYLTYLVLNNFKA